MGNGLRFFYDSTGVAGIIYFGGVYHYRKDAQGNVIAIVNSSGGIEVEYAYDAWGNVQVSGTNVGLNNNNPFRYRGYFYDTETGLYYLKNRYYDPVMGRFISPDDLSYLDPDSINGLNLYAYCNNNPVMRTDPNGNFPLLLLLVVTIVGGALIGATVHDIAALIEDGGLNIEIKDLKDEEGNLTGEKEVEIQNSHRILTPWVQWVCSFYLNHINPETKDIIKGTTFGVQGEWMSHNVAYYGLAFAESVVSAFGGDTTKIKELMGGAKPANIGGTVFSNKEHVFSTIMQYINWFIYPIPTLIDYIIHLRGE